MHQSMMENEEGRDDIVEDESSSNRSSIDIHPSNMKYQIRKTGLSWYGGAFMVVNATLGAGMLNFPQAYDHAGGFFMATVILMITVLFAIGALLILAQCSDIKGSATYQDVVFTVCGQTWHQICAITIAVYLFGTTVTLLIVIGDQYERGLSSLHGSDYCHYWYMTREFTLIATAVVGILPLCFSKRIDFLKYTSVLGVVAIVYLVFLVIYQYFHVDNRDAEPEVLPKSWTNIFLVVPCICFGFQCHISSVPVYSCLRNRRPVTFGLVVTGAMLISVAAYSLVAGFGYMTYAGSAVPSDILLMYDATNAVVLIGVVTLAVKMVVAFPVLAFCGRTAVDGIWVSARHLTPAEAEFSEPLRRIVISLMWFTSTLLLATVTPNIGWAIKILGSLAAVLIFIFPGWILFRHVCSHDPNLFLLKDRLLIAISIMYQAIGVFLLGVVLVQSFISGEPADKIRLCK